MSKSTTNVERIAIRKPGAVLDEYPGLGVPQNHVGPYYLAGLGRTIWWTGRVAIGLRYEKVRGTGTVGSPGQTVARPVVAPH